MSAGLLLSPTGLAAMVAASAVPVPIFSFPGCLKQPQLASSMQPDNYKLWQRPYLGGLPIRNSRLRDSSRRNGP